MLKLWEIVEMQRDALDFYANTENWASHDTNRVTNNKVFDICLFDFDRNFQVRKDYAGKKARETLAQVETMIEQLNKGDT
jgi:hypothetical protein